MKLTKELVPADVLQEIFDSPIPYRDAQEEKLTKVSDKCRTVYTVTYYFVYLFHSLVIHLHSCVL